MHAMLFFFYCYWFIQLQKTIFNIILFIQRFLPEPGVVVISDLFKSMLHVVSLTGQSWKNYPTTLHVMSLVW